MGYKYVTISPSKLTFTGTQVNYYFVCKRKLWLFSNDLRMEQESELVDLGRFLHEESYPRERKEIDLGPIKIDFLSRGGAEVHDVKRSRRIHEAHVNQMLYYLYFLKRMGVEARGVIDYPRLRRKERVQLTPEKEKKLEEAIKDMEEVLSKRKPPEVEKKSYCRKCSYYELCWC